MPFLYSFLKSSFLFFVFFYSLSNPISKENKWNDICLHLDENSNIDTSNYSFKLSFFPEGGSLIDGFVNRVAVKLDKPNSSSILKGVLIEDGQKKLLEFRISKLGLGEFIFIPKHKKNYSVIIEHNEEHLHFVLPAILEKGVLLQMVQYNNHFRANLQSTLDDGLKGYSYTVRQHNRIIQKGEIVKETSEVFIKIPNEIINKGVLSFNLQNKDGFTVIKRSVFYKPLEDLVKMDVILSEKRNQNYDSISLNFFIENLMNESLLNTCISIRKLSKENHTDFKTFHLLSSRMDKTYESLFFEESEQKKYLDILMLTIDDESADIRSLCKSRFMMKQEITIKGTVKHLFNGQRPSNANVALYYKNRNEFGMDEVQTDSRGQFAFTKLKFSDTTSVLLRLKNVIKNGNSNFSPSDYVIEIDSSNTFLKITNIESIKNDGNSILNNSVFSQQETSKLDSMYLTSKNLIKLKTVEIQADKKMKRDRFESRRFLYGKPSQTIDFGKLPQIPNINVLEVLRGRVPGLFLSDNQNFYVVIVRLTQMIQNHSFF